MDYYVKVIKGPTFLDSLKLTFQISLIINIVCSLRDHPNCSPGLYRPYRGEGPTDYKTGHTYPPHHSGLVLHKYSISKRFTGQALYKLGLIDAQTDFPLLLYTKNNIGIILGYLWKEVPFVAYFSLSLMASINKTLGKRQKT